MQSLVRFRQDQSGPPGVTTGGGGGFATAGMNTPRLLLSSQKAAHAAMPAMPAPIRTGAMGNGSAAATGKMGTGGGGARLEGRSAPAVEGSAETGDAQVTPSACVIVTMEFTPRVVRHDGPSARVAFPFLTSKRSPAERPSPAPI